MSTPSLLFGKSFTWPSEAFTTKSLPRYLLIVFAFAGDSTITSDFFAAILRLSNKSSAQKNQQALFLQSPNVFLSRQLPDVPTYLQGKQRTINVGRGQWQLREQRINGNCLLKRECLPHPGLGRVELRLRRSLHLGDQRCKDFFSNRVR